MPDQPLKADPGDETDVGPIADRRPGTPRWVKVFGLIGIIVVLVVVIALVTGRGGPGGGHGPGRHSPSEQP